VIAQQCSEPRIERRPAPKVCEQVARGAVCARVHDRDAECDRAGEDGCAVERPARIRLGAVEVLGPECAAKAHEGARPRAAPGGVRFADLDAAVLALVEVGHSGNNTTNLVELVHYDIPPLDQHLASPASPERPSVAAVSATLL
jgi:hypothetical protein